MDRIRKAWRSGPEYEPLSNGAASQEQETEETITQVDQFSWIEYSIFVLLGVSMLWAWNMFLAAGPYLQDRFQSDAWVSDNFQSGELLVSTVANLGGMLVLTKLQAKASYPRRIMLSLVLNMIIFSLLAISTRVFLDVSAQAYFAFIVVTVFISSLATALCQNGVFAFVAGFGQPRYTQGIMAGQGIAGVLPCIAQIVLVISVSTRDASQHSLRDQNDTDPSPPPTDGRAAFGYFLTATGISALTLVAFLYLLRLHAIRSRTKPVSDQASTAPPPGLKKSIPLSILARKLRWLALAVFLTFAITMVYPVYTQRILSVRPPQKSSSPLLRPASFIPLAFLCWNTGDLLGRLLPAVPALTLTHRPRVVFLLAALRVLFIPLYQLCNIRGRGAVVDSDVFYLIVVQGLFGMTNGYVGSTCMMGAGEWVGEDEREAAGGFMSLCLVLGLTVGSGLSFLVGG